MTTTHNPTHRGRASAAYALRKSFAGPADAPASSLADVRLTEAQRIALAMYRARQGKPPKPITIRRFSWQTDDEPS